MPLLIPLKCIYLKESKIQNKANRTKQKILKISDFLFNDF